MTNTNNTISNINNINNIDNTTENTNSFTLTDSNYYSLTANQKYMSVSQFKDLIGTTTHTACEESGVMRAKGLLQPQKTTALLVGSYVDSYFEGTLDEFRENNPEIFKKTGDRGLKADYVQAEQIITRIESDDLFSKYMSGQKQVIQTGNLFGIDWKIKMDSYHPNEKIVDLKVMKNMKPIWSDVTNCYVDFIRYWGYDIQGAVYQKIVEINTGKKLPFYIACATKETPSNIEIIEITQPYLDAALEFVKDNLQHAINLKDGTVEPTHCNTCDYCKSTKTLKQPISIEDIMPKGITNIKSNATPPKNLFDD